MVSPAFSFPDFKPKVYLVDDDEDDRFLFLDAITELQHELIIKEFADGESLMNTLTKTVELPDIIFLDLNMPRLGGLECLDFLRKKLGDTITKVFIISTSSSVDMIETTKNKGADHYICKPRDFNELKILLRIALQKAISPTSSPFLLNELVK